MYYYFAYGSNLNKQQMSWRCPGARPIGKLVLPNARLVFRGVADVEYDDALSVQGGLWKITRACERTLDRYEGVKSGLYRKENIQVNVEGQARKCAGLHNEPPILRAAVARLPGGDPRRLR
jgi:gamma-glutamylcyclotransferase (GGCT)/AIG2-like uncharacterized protein YtfP